MIGWRFSEPYDRVRFGKGSVETTDRARFRFFLTAPTPVAALYLPQEPRLLMAGAPWGASVAGR